MRKFITMLVGFVLMGFLATPVQAKVITQEKGTVRIGKEEVIQDDLYIGAEAVEIEGRIEGDVYVGAGSVRFDGVVTGDLVIGSGEVTIRGEVGDDLWIGAGNALLLGAKVGDGVSIGSGQVMIDEESTIGGSLLVGAGRLEVRAPVGRNLMAGAGEIRIDAPVAGEIRVGGETVELGEKTAIGGDLTYMSEQELSMAEGATVAGEIKQVDANKYAPKGREWEKESGKAMAGVWAGMNVFSYLGALVVGLVSLWLVKKPTLEIAEKIKKNFLTSLGWGLLIVVLTGPALLMLTVTGIGLPLAMILGLMLLVDLYLAKIWASMAAGQVMQKQFGWKKMKDGWVFVIGLAAYYALKMVPLVGTLVSLVAFLSGLGGAWMYLKSMKK